MNEQVFTTMQGSGRRDIFL